ncbi:MAG: hypothetical protein JWO57_3564 [Pseudonocardiales bacterium]|nr:hypothetical protein [Pseudonocardiales bacterium]
MTGYPEGGRSPADGHRVTVLHGGQNSDDDTPRRHGNPAGCAGASRNRLIVPGGGWGSDAEQDHEVPPRRPDAASGRWPEWARPQLRSALSITRRVQASGRRTALANELYRRWFNPIVAPPVELGRPWLPLAGLYRSAHAGSASRIVIDGVSVVDRHDVVGRDGWWRTWGDDWLPTRSRSAAVRIMLSPRADALSAFVATITTALLGEPVPWLLACPTDGQRLRRPASAVLYLPHVDALPLGLLTLLRPTLRQVMPPLCLPLAPGAALAEYPDNGMSFGEHRCHLLALALRTPIARRAPLQAIADVFASHGIDPGQPYRS